MTDQPPPPSDKKPRRRSAPRKRSATKRETKAAEATSAAPQSAEAAIATGDADDSSRAGAATIEADARSSAEAPADARDANAGSPEAVAAKLDPRPLDDAGDRGDAPASDSPLANADGKKTNPGAAHENASAPHVRHAGTPAAARGDVASKPPVERATSPAPTPSKDSEPQATAPFPRQAELRPGELIRVPLSVRWRDLDAFNHVNNSKYLSYLEEARLRWMLAMPGMGMDDNVAPVVAASNLNYRRPIEWPGDIVIELFVERIGGSSLTIGHRIVDANDGGTLYCDGNVVMVWIDRNSGRSAPLPESVRAACR